MTTGVFVPAAVECLVPFVEAGVLGTTEVNAVATFAHAGDESSPEVLLAAALAVRAPLHGHVCVDLTSVRDTVVSSFEATAELTTDVGDLLPPTDGETDEAPDPTVRGDGAGASAVLDDLPWPEPDAWTSRVAASSLVRTVVATTAPGAPTDHGDDSGTEQRTPLVLDRERVYLSRYWSLERALAADLLRRSALSDRGAAHDLDPAATAAVTRLFADDGVEADDDQLAAALACVHRYLVVISGGPGTGKTTTVARFLAGFVEAVESSGTPLRIALAAPTGKAAARMTEALRAAVASLGKRLAPEVAAALDGLEATTIHRLLGRGHDGRWYHRPGNPLSHDVVVVDEASMVSLSLMAHLLAAVRDAAKVVLVGDPDQLASVEAGAVLGDIVGSGAERGTEGSPNGIRGSVRRLGTVHRQAEGSTILELASRIRSGDAAAVVDVLRSGHQDLRWIDPTADHRGEQMRALTTQVTEVAAGLVGTAATVRTAGDDDEAGRRLRDALGGLTRHKVLCALRRGPGSVEDWNRRVEDGLRSAGLIGADDWYDGRPVMVTENDYLNAVFNGDVGLALHSGDSTSVCFPRADGPQVVPAARLDRIATQWAMTVHKSQGSEFDHVVVTLPDVGSRILTRELLYTAVTRARRELTLVATEAAVRTAVTRPVARASGLAARLRVPDG